MSTSSGRRRTQRGFAGAHARQITAVFHEGTCAEFLRCHEMRARGAARETARERRKFAQCLFHRVTDSRNVRLAVEHVATHGGQAPGPNNLRLKELDEHERWQLARVLAESMRTGKYEPGPSRTVAIPKGSGRGTRPLRIQNVEDRVAQRAIVQGVQPWLDPQFSDLSFGYRPGKSREGALAAAEWYAVNGGLATWIAEDARDAFERVPHARLLDVLRRQGLEEDLVDLMARAALAGRRKGIRQGGPMSPLLLNALLDWFVDRHWKRYHPGTPLIRVADDHLVVCADGETARRRYDELEGRLRGTGMVLKGSPDKTIRDLAGGQRVEWLGYDIGLGSDRLDVRMTDGVWWSLSEHLRMLQEEPEAPLAVEGVILGWVSQQGAVYRPEDVGRCYEGIISRVEEAGFSEFPERECVEAVWRNAYLRWIRVRRDIVLRLLRGSDAGSAQRHVNLSTRSRNRRASPLGALPRLARRRDVDLYCDGACLATGRIGGWAYILVDRESGTRCHKSDSHPRTTNNRMELLAVIKGLEALRGPSRVHLTVDSQYVSRGIGEQLARWKANDWQCSSRRGRKRIANVRLWRRLDTLLQNHEVVCQWVRGHSGHPENELADHLAHHAAMAYQLYRRDPRASTRSPG